jgi:hypothetical protein
MIVRLMGEGQYRVDDSLLGKLNEIDDRALAAIDSGDEIELDRALDELHEVVRSEGEQLDDSDLSASDVIVPPSDLTLEESKRFMHDDGFIPDLPVPG